jgi:hypothetical protein
MKKTTLLSLALLVFFCMGLSAVTAQAWSMRRGGGGGQPDPFTYNVHFELADDEYYMLDGTIVLGPSLNSGRTQAYLKVDLADQTWLANPYRKSVHGLYPLEGAVANWRRSENQRVKLAVRARVVTTPGSRSPLVTLRCIPELSDIP